MKEQVKSWPAGDVYVGCSGNFTVERVLAEEGRFSIHGNDVTLYSSAIGTFLSGQSLHVGLREDMKGRYGWLDAYLKKPADTAATMMLAARGFPKPGVDNAYYQRIEEAYKNQWRELYAQTVARLEKLNLRLASYYCGGVLEMLTELPADVPVITYPPFFAGDYEAMFAGLDRLFEWDAPEYRELDEESVGEVIEWVTNRPRWIFGVHRRLPKYESWLRGVTQTTNRATPIFMYTSGGHERVTAPRQEIIPVTQARLGQQDEIGSNLSIAPLSYPQFCALRSQYMNIHIRPRQCFARNCGDG